MKKTFKALLLFVIVLSLLLSLISCKEKPNVNIRFFEGESIVITTDKTAVVIDASQSDLNAIKKFLKNNNTELIGALIFSNLNEDVLLCAAKLTEEVDASNIYVPAQAYNGAGYEEFMVMCDNLAVDPYTVDGSVSFGVGDVSVRVYASVNDIEGCLITRVVMGKRAMLFCADADEKRICEFLEYDKNRYDVIKMPLNDETFDSLNDLTETAKPDMAIVSQGAKDQKQMLNKCKVYSLDKAVSFNYSGKKIKPVE